MEVIKVKDFYKFQKYKEIQGSDIAMMFRNVILKEVIENGYTTFMERGTEISINISMLDVIDSIPANSSLKGEEKVSELYDFLRVLKKNKKDFIVHENGYASSVSLNLGDYAEFKNLYLEELLNCLGIPRLEIRNRNTLLDLFIFEKGFVPSTEEYTDYMLQKNFDINKAYPKYKGSISKQIRENGYIGLNKIFPSIICSHQNTKKILGEFDCSQYRNPILAVLGASELIIKIIRMDVNFDILERELNLEKGFIRSNFGDSEFKRRINMPDEVRDNCIYGVKTKHFDEVFAFAICKALSLPVQYEPPIFKQLKKENSLSLHGNFKPDLKTPNLYIEIINSKRLAENERSLRNTNRESEYMRNLNKKTNTFNEYYKGIEKYVWFSFDFDKYTVKENFEKFKSFLKYKGETFHNKTWGEYNINNN